jgi:hypothetical protein
MITKPKDTAELVKALRKLNQVHQSTEDCLWHAASLLADFIDDPEVTEAFDKLPIPYG